MGGKEKAGKEKTQRKIEKKEKTAKTEKVGKKEKEKTPVQSIGDNIQKISEAKVQSDIKNAEKLLQRAKEKPLLTAIGEGMQKGAEAKVESDIENAEQLLQRTKERPLLKAIEAGIQKGAEAKVNFDLAKSEKLIQKGFGAIPGINIAAETAKEYMDMLGELLLTMDEGLKTGAKTGEGPKKSGEKVWFVDAVQSYERDLFTQGENIIGFGKGLMDIGKGTLAFAGDFVEYLQGQNPEFLKEVWEGIAAAGMGVLNGLSHPEETLQALDEAMSKATPEDIGRLGAYAFVAALPVGAPAGSSRLLSLLKKISPDMGNMGLTIKIVDEAGNASRAADKILDGVEAPKGNMKPFEGGSGIKETFNFTRKTNLHMNDPARAVPVQTLKDAIAIGKALPDPQGTSATMYYTTIYKNGKLYNFEVLYDQTTNTIMHFKYTSEAIGPLPAVVK